MDFLIYSLLMAKLLYGSGLRLTECLRLRIQDVDFGQNKIYVRAGTGGKRRIFWLFASGAGSVKADICSKYLLWLWHVSLDLFYEPVLASFLLFLGCANHETQMLIS